MIFCVKSIDFLKNRLEFRVSKIFNLTHTFDSQGDYDVKGPGECCLEITPNWKIMTYNNSKDCVDDCLKDVSISRNILLGVGGTTLVLGTSTITNLLQQLTGTATAGATLSSGLRWIRVITFSTALGLTIGCTSFCNEHFCTKKTQARQVYYFDEGFLSLFTWCDWRTKYVCPKTFWNNKET